MSIGIYKITDLTNNKIYIGQSIHVQQRFSQHKRKHNNLIDKAIKEKGVQNFSFEIIQECNIEELNKKEIYWIEYFDSMNSGYNKTSGGSYNTDAYIFLDKTIVDSIKQDLKTTTKEIKLIALQYEVDKSTIYRINTGKIHFDIKEKYPLRKTFQLKKKKYKYKCKKCGKIISSPSAFLCTECYKIKQAQQSKINSITREELKQKIRTQSFTSIGKEFDVSDNTIRKWCDKFNLPRTKKEIKSFSEEQWNFI